MEVWFIGKDDEDHLFMSDDSLSESQAHRIAENLELEGFTENAWVEEI